MIDPPARQAQAMSRIAFFLTIPSLTVLGTAMPAFAQDASSPVIYTGGDRVTIGIGAGVVPTYIGSKSTSIVPAAAIQGQVGGRSFNLQGTSLTVDAIAGKGKPGWKVQGGPVASLRLDRTGMLHNHAVAALGHIGTAWELGGWVGVQRTGVITSDYDTLSFSTTWQHDVNGIYHSYVVSPGMDYSTPLSTRAYVDLSAGADYVGRGFGATYYDVSPAEAAASGLPDYIEAGRAGWKDWNLNLLAARSLTGNLAHGFAVFATVDYARLLGRFARSPIVDGIGNARQKSGGLGVAYTF